MTHSNDIRSSWEANAANWIATIENNELESRRLVTNRAIIDTILHCQPQRVLDLGCGEGWLSREIRNHDIEVWGTDAVVALVEAAEAKDGHYYFPYSYEQIISGKHDLPVPFDLVAINFALLDNELTAALIHYLPNLLTPHGKLVIQTLHAYAVASVDQYRSGWKEGSWNGMQRQFVLPYQWYFRTLEDWIRLFIEAGFSVGEIIEPVHPDTGKPLSYIFVLSLNNRL